MVNYSSLTPLVNQGVDVMEAMAMAKDVLGIAVVGTGFGQKVHIPGLQAHHRTRVVAVYHRDRAKAEAIAAAHAIPQACDRLEDLVNLVEVDGVAISTPPFCITPWRQRSFRPANTFC
jgi:ornithine cyclodeaminase/alanine dehydrogenase-like protein (mu-crystallin family)